MAKNELQKQGRIVMLPVDCIEPSPYQARTAFDEPEIAALAVSILQNGLLQPISVRRVGLRKYQLIAGERRLRACRLAKLEKVPAILADYDDSESAALGLLENLQRSQLDPFDTARGIKEVIRLWGCTQAEAARRLGLSQPALANKLRLLTLTPEQQQLCAANCRRAAVPRHWKRWRGISSVCGRRTNWWTRCWPPPTAPAPAAAPSPWCGMSAFL